MYARDNAADASNGRQPPPAELVTAACTALRLLADPTRLRIVDLVSTSDMDVAGLAATIGMARPAISQHLAKLRLAGLVRMRREGRRAIYTARGGHVRRLVDEVFSAAEHHLAQAPEHD